MRRRAAFGALLCAVALAFVPTASANFLETLKNIMPDLPKIEIMLNHFQQISLIGSLNIDIPFKFEASISWMDSFSLDMDALSGWGVPKLGLRWMFTMFATVFPLFLTFMMLFFFNSGFVVVWYFMMLGSIACVGGAVTLLMLPRNSDQYHGNKAFPIQEMLYAGVGMLVVCLCMALLQFQIGKSRMGVKIRGNQIEKLHELDDSYRKKWPKMQTVRNFLISGLMMFFALIFSQAINPFGMSYPAKGTQPAAFMSIAGMVLLGVASTLAMRLLCSCCEKGRWLLHKLNGIWVNSFITVVLVLLSACYIPVLVVMLRVMSCEDVTCALGSRFQPKKSLMEQLHAADKSLDFGSECIKNCCDLCTWNSTCPTALSHKLCPEVTDLRVHSDHSLSCPEHIYPYFLPAALVMWVSFTMGIPYLYYTLIHQHVLMFDKVKTRGDSNEEKWSLNMGCSQNSGKSLYEVYEKKWRYYKLFLLGQKLFLAIVTVLLWNLEEMGAYITAGVHIFFFCVSIYSQPYIATSCDLMATCAIGADFCTTAMALVAIYQGDLPAGVWIGMGAANVALPIMCAGAGGLYWLQMRGLRVKGEEQRDEMLKLKEEKDKEKEKEGKVEAPTVNSTVGLSKKHKPGGRDRVMQRRNDRKEGGGGQPKKVHPIFLKTSQNRRKDVEVMLMDDGADPNTQDNFENTPLHYAALEGHKAIVKTLLRYGADVNIPNKAGNTPLHVAFAFKREGIQEYLIELGADVSARNSYGSDPYEVEGEFLEEFRSDMREDRGDQKASMVPTKQQKTAKVAPAKGEEKEMTAREAEADAQKQYDKSVEEAAAAEEEENDAKDDLQGRVAQQRKLEADDKLMHWGKQATMEDPEIAQTVDRKMDEATIKSMSRFFLNIGATSFLALGICLVGLAYSNQDLVLHESDSEGLSKEQSTKFEFLDYPGWDEFQDHCCCMDSPHNNHSAPVDDSYELSEIWICKNGMRKERMRIGYIKDRTTMEFALVNGTGLRPFCGRTWAPGYCSPVWNPKYGHFVVDVCDYTIAINSTVGLLPMTVLSDLW